jgi:hypothetical protein
MKSLAMLFLALSLPGSKVAAPPRLPVEHLTTQHARERGMWYMAESGHAVFCYGPVMLVKQPDGGLQHVATVCRGDQVMVPLKD